MGEDDDDGGGVGAIMGGGTCIISPLPLYLSSHFSHEFHTIVFQKKNRWTF